MATIKQQEVVPEASEISKLIAEYPYPLLAAFYGAKREDVLQYYAGGILRACESDSCNVVTAYHEGDLTGLAALEVLPWESGIFGHSMAKISLMMNSRRDVGIYDDLVRQVLEAAHEHKIVHISCKIPVEDCELRHSLQRMGFLLMDTTLEFAWDTPKVQIEELANSWLLKDNFHRSNKIFKFNIQLREAIKSDIGPLEQLAREAFTHRTKTRYSSDPNLPLEKTGELYARWFRNSCENKFADVVLVATLEEKPVGYLTFKVERELSEAVGIRFGYIGTGAVQPQMEGRAVLPSLLCGTIKWCNQNNVRFARGRVLVNNYGMYKSSLLTGAVITGSYHTFHKWLGIS